MLNERSRLSPNKSRGDVGDGGHARIQVGRNVAQSVRLGRNHLCTAWIFHEHNDKGYRHLRIIYFRSLFRFLSGTNQRIPSKQQTPCITNNQLATLPLNQSNTLTGSEFARVEIHLCFSPASSRSLSSSSLLNFPWHINSCIRSNSMQLHPALTTAVIAGSPIALYWLHVRCS